MGNTSFYRNQPVKISDRFYNIFGKLLIIYFLEGAKMNDKIIGNEKNILFYNDEEGNVKIEVLLENEDVWLNTEALATLFNIDRSGIVRHINNIYKDDELSEDSTCAKIAHTPECVRFKFFTVKI